MEFTLLAAAAIGVFGYWVMLRWEAPRGNAAGCSVDLWEAGLMSAAGGLLVGRLVAMAAVGIAPWSDPAQIILIRSGVSTEATVAGTCVVFALITRRSFVVAADGVSAAALAGLAGWHAGCIPTNACLGTPSALPWSWALDASTVSRHPVELYAALLLASGAVLVAAWKQHGRPPLGAPAGVAVAIAAGVRLTTEPMRLSLGRAPVALYVAGVVIGVGAVAAAYAVMVRSRGSRAGRDAI